MSKKIKIGLLGTRGIPNKYGGFEQFVQFFAEYLDNKNFDVTVYNPHFHKDQDYKLNKVNIIYKWCPENILGAASHFIFDFLCLRDSLKRNHDIIFEFGYGTVAISYLFLPIHQSTIVTNMDGMEWKRGKWNYLIKKFMKWSEGVAVKKSNILIADNNGIQRYLKKKYNKDSIMIPYGSNIFNNPNLKILKNFDVKDNDYCLVIARMEPENNIEMILDGFVNSKLRMKLLVVGNNENKYGKFLLKKYKNYDRIVFLNGIYDLNIINNLRFFSKYYFHGHSVGGTNPSLLEAMGCGSLIFSHDNIYNKDVLGNDAFYFSSSDEISNLLSKKDLLDKKRDLFVENNIDKIKFTYNWDTINRMYSSLIKEVEI